MIIHIYIYIFIQICMYMYLILFIYIYTLCTYIYIYDIYRYIYIYTWFVWGSLSPVLFHLSRLSSVLFCEQMRLQMKTAWMMLTCVYSLQQVSKVSKHYCISIMMQFNVYMIQYMCINIFLCTPHTHTIYDSFMCMSTIDIQQAQLSAREALVIQQPERIMSPYVSICLHMSPRSLNCPPKSSLSNMSKPLNSRVFCGVDMLKLNPIEYPIEYPITHVECFQLWIPSWETGPGAQKGNNHGSDCRPVAVCRSQGICKFFVTRRNCDGYPVLDC